MHAHAVSITSNTLKPGSTTKFTRTARTVRKPTQHGISYAKNAISAGYRFTSGGTATTGIMTMAGTKTHGTMITTILTGQAVKGVDLSCSVCSFLSSAKVKTWARNSGLAERRRFQPRNQVCHSYSKAVLFTLVRSRS